MSLDWAALTLTIPLLDHRRLGSQTGVVMLIYLDNALKERLALRAAEGRALTHQDLYDAIMEGAAERVRNPR